MPVDLKCCKQVTDTLITVKETQKSATFTNPLRESYTVVRVDGCVLVNVRAADYVVIASSGAAVIVELKGVDVNHALDQIRATAAYWRQHCPEHKPIGALIVCSRYPRVDTKVQKMKQTLRREFRMKLQVVSRNRIFSIDEVV